MQEAIHRWEGGLKATGGAIVSEKSWVYPISFKFDRAGKWEYMNQLEIEFEFEVIIKIGFVYYFEFLLRNNFLFLVDKKHI